MKYIELYINSIKKKSTQPKVAALAHPLNYNLPGLKSYSQMKAEEVIKFKKEFNGSLNRHQKLVLLLKAAKGDKRKELKQVLASSNEHLSSLLQKIGSSTPTERTQGFEVPNAQ